MADTPFHIQVNGIVIKFCKRQTVILPSPYFGHKQSYPFSAQFWKVFVLDGFSYPAKPGYSRFSRFWKIKPRHYGLKNHFFSFNMSLLNCNDCLNTETTNGDLPAFWVKSKPCILTKLVLISYIFRFLKYICPKDVEGGVIKAAACLENLRLRVQTPLWPSSFQKKNVSTPLTRKDWILWRAFMSESVHKNYTQE